MKTSLLAVILIIVPFLAAHSATEEQTVKTAANETREDFAIAVQTATKRAAAQANAVPKASVKVLPAATAAAR